MLVALEEVHTMWLQVQASNWQAEHLQVKGSKMDETDKSLKDCFDPCIL